MEKNLYVSELSSELKAIIENELLNVLDNKEDIENAMDSRLCDLEDTIDIDNVILKVAMDGLKFMQNNDRNGSWLDAIEELKEEETTVESEISYMIETLKEWIIDAPNNVTYKNKLDILETLQG